MTPSRDIRADEPAAFFPDEYLYTRPHTRATILPPSRGAVPLQTEAAGAAPPDAFGPFRVLHQIGAGALGPVFRAFDPEADRLVAVKVFQLGLPPDRMHQLVSGIERLIAVNLRHAAILAPIAAGTDGIVAYSAQPFAAGDSLDVVIRDRGPVVPEVALGIAAQLAGALDFAAVVDVHHGTLHPRDVLLADDEVRVTGLGVARVLERLGAQPPVRLPYTAPERVAGAPWDRRADVFSLAALIHELLWGRRIAGLGGEAARPLTVLAGGHLPQLRSTFARALAEQPSDRFDTALDFAVALKGAFPDVAIAPVVSSTTGHGGSAIETKQGRERLPFDDQTISPRIEDRAGPIVIDTAHAVESADSIDVEQPPGASRQSASARPPVVPRFGETAPQLVYHDDASEGGTPVDSPLVVDCSDSAVEPPQSVDSQKSPVTSHQSPVASQASPVDSYSSIDTPALPAGAPLEAIVHVSAVLEDDLLIDIGRGKEEAPPRTDIPLRAAPAHPPAATPPTGVSDGVWDRKVSQPSLKWIERETTPVVHDESLLFGASSEESPPRRPLWPIGVALVAGLAVGFAGGYFVGGRQNSAPLLATAPAAPAPPAPSAASPTVSRASSEPPAASAPAKTSPSTASARQTPEKGGPSSSPARPESEKSPASTAVRPASEKGAPAGAAARPEKAATVDASLLVRTVPADAVVFVDGVERGRTPTTIRDLKQGAHRIRIARDGYVTQNRRVEIATGRKPKPLTLTLPRARAAPAGRAAAAPSQAAPAKVGALAGEIEVQSRPPGAKVFLDNKLVGTTPMAAAAAPAGEHVLRIEHEGYKRWTSTVRVVSGQRYRVTASLER